MKVMNTMDENKLKKMISSIRESGAKAEVVYVDKIPMLHIIYNNSFECIKTYDYSGNMVYYKSSSGIETVREFDNKGFTTKITRLGKYKPNKFTHVVKVV